jgi:predicted permease
VQDSLTLKIADGVMLDIFSAAFLLCLIFLFIETKGIHEGQPRSWSAVRWSLFMLGASIAVFLFTQWLMRAHGITALINPFLIPVVIIAKVLLIEISKPKPQVSHAPKHAGTK